MNLTLKSKAQLIDNVWSFVFDAHPAQTWTAGQYIQVELPHDDPDAEGTKRFFTVSGAPFEKHIQITTRITSTTFKQALANLAVGAELKLLLSPEGDFVWRESDKPRVFVAAGIGITPYRSMLAERNHNQETLDVTLIYANRSDAIPFREELDAIAAAHPEFKINYITGLVTPDRLTETDPDILGKLIYISGPEPMVEALGDGLRGLGLPEDQLIQDFFPNYNESNF